MPRDGSGVYTRPPGTDGVPDTTIESSKYNGFVGDVETDLNAIRPVIAGGTGGNNATQARLNLQAERAMQVVTNYDSHVWEAGSFYSGVGATGAPNATAVFLGTVQVQDSGNIVVQATDLSTGYDYTRRKVANVWATPTWVSAPFNKVDKAGDVMTGDLALIKATPILTLDATAGTEPYFVGSKAGKKRWSIDMGNNAAETGSNAGSQLVIYRYNDAGDAIGPVVTLDRPNGNAFFGAAVTAYGIVQGMSYVRAKALNGSDSPALHFLSENDANAGGLYWDRVDNRIKMTHTGGGMLSMGIGTVTVTGNFDATGSLSTAGTLTVSGAATVGGTLTTTGMTSANGGIQVGATGLAVTGPSNLTGAVTGGSTITGVATITVKAANSTASPAFVLANEAGGNAGGLYFDRPLDETRMTHYSGTHWRIGTGWVASTSDTAYKPNGGPWIAGSDARIKTVHGEYARGLDEVLALRPVVYSYKGNDQIGGGRAIPGASLHAGVTDKQFVGMVAQQAELEMPEMVSKVSGFIDGKPVNDLRMLDNGALVYALVNAVKTLTARIEVLEARLTS